MSRVLILEPNPDVRRLLGVVVSRLGHDPVVYPGGSVRLDDVDAAVIEPGAGEGLRVAAGMRALGRPVVFTSIFPDDDEVLALEPAAYLVKPFALSQLERVLAAALPSAAPA